MPSPLINLPRLGRLIRKELRESLRDRRTILTLVLMPLLLYPLLAMAFQQLILANRVEKETPVYQIGFVSREEEVSLLRYLQVGERVLTTRHGTAPTKEMPTPPPPPYLDPVPLLMPTILADPEEAVRQGVVDVGVRLTPAGAFRANPRQLLHVQLQLSYRHGSTTSREAILYLERLTTEANMALVGDGMRILGIPQRGDPVRMRAVEQPDEAGAKPSIIPVLVPLILILMTMTGAVYPAIDLTAGERERGTLEILVAAPIPRLSVLLAKYVAVLTVALLTAVINLGTMAMTLQVTGIGSALFGTALSAGVFAQVLALLALFAAFFSAVLLILTSFARSFKEAQAYLIPLMLFCLMPGVLALMPGLRLDSFLAVVPLVNIVLLSRDVLEGTASAATSGIVVTTTLLYALGAVALAARIFGTEAVLSSESSGWGDLFRRAEHARPSAVPATALLCLAMLFPAYFCANTSLAHLTAGMEVRLAVATVVNVVLFAGVPLAVAWWGRVQFVSGLGLRLPSPVALLIAVLLGVTAWPLVQELILLLQQAGFTTLRAEHLNRVKEALVTWRSISPVFLVVVLAVVPAVVEELFFRGFLLRALLEGDRPMRAIVGSAVLFALFHLLVSDALAVERLPPSLLLGLILGWLAYRSGSIWPGVVLHLLNNAFIVLLGYYEPTLVEAGWLTAGQEHLSGLVLVGSGVGVALGVGWLALTRTRSGEISAGWNRTSSRKAASGNA